MRGARLIARATAGALVGYAHAVGFSDDAVLRMRTFRRGNGVLLRTSDEFGHPIIVRYSHFGAAELVRPEKDSPWQLQAAARHRRRDSRRVAGAARRRKDARHAQRRRREPRRSAHAIAKLDDAGDPEGYFTRVASLAMRTSWGRFPDAPKLEETSAERIVLRATRAAARESIVLGTRRHRQRREDATLSSARPSIVSRSRWRRTRTSSGRR